MLEVNTGAEAVKSLHRKCCFLSSFFRVNESERSLAAKVFLCELQLLCLFLSASVFLEKKWQSKRFWIIGKVALSKPVPAEYPGMTQITSLSKTEKGFSLLACLSTNTSFQSSSQKQLWLLPFANILHSKHETWCTLSCTPSKNDHVFHT